MTPKKPVGRTPKATTPPSTTRADSRPGPPRDQSEQPEPDDGLEEDPRGLASHGYDPDRQRPGKAADIEHGVSTDVETEVDIDADIERAGLVTRRPGEAEDIDTEGDRGSRARRDVDERR